MHKSGKAAQRNYITELHNRINQEIPGRKSAPGFSELLDRKNKSADPNRSKPDPRFLYRDRGYAIYEMDLAMAGEEFYAEIKRSTNGGGENSPALEGEDDFYELFLAALEI